MITIRELHGDALAEWMRATPPSWADGTHTDALEAAKTAGGDFTRTAIFPTMRLLVAADDGEPVAVLLYSDGDQYEARVYLRHFDTRPDRRLKGLALRLVRRMLDDEPRRPVGSMAISKAGEAVLKNAGFAETGDVPYTHILK